MICNYVIANTLDVEKWILCANKSFHWKVLVWHLTGEIVSSSPPWNSFDELHSRKASAFNIRTIFRQRHKASEIVYERESCRERALLGLDVYIRSSVNAGFWRRVGRVSLWVGLRGHAKRQTMLIFYPSPYSAYKRECISHFHSCSHSTFFACPYR